MTPHKFAIGQIVDFDTRITSVPRASGPYQVVRVLPVKDVSSQTYRIKSKAELFERSAEAINLDLLVVGFHGGNVPSGSAAFGAGLAVT